MHQCATLIEQASGYLAADHTIRRITPTARASAAAARALATRCGATLGAAPTTVLRRVTLPLIAPSLGAGAALVFLAAVVYFVVAPKGREQGLEMYHDDRAAELAEQGVAGYVDDWYDEDIEPEPSPAAAAGVATKKPPRATRLASAPARLAASTMGGA